MSSTRQLAAIMFTDIVGYTALMGRDEQRAFELLDKNRKLQKPIVEQYNGRWIKELGDGVMASFPTVSEAVYAAIKIQKECVPTEDLLLRIGIHLGEVVFEHDDVFGDGVNIASRIQSIAPPGSICISESVRNNVANKNDIVIEFLKVEHLKNVKEPVRIYKVMMLEDRPTALSSAGHSILPGYQYDVFISYRQKDNKGERWVSEFAERVRAELEATVKEDISIYFDENPHDGLLETHDVDESLKEKLKCLIFVPILSQTYCDTRSFAWQNEFLPFIKIASEDKIGLAVKLVNGNVTSRVLPVRIHELEAADLKLLEDVLKTRLRPIDFIFKSPGVNRPLRPNEEDPLKNSLPILYRDQVNKTANAIKELISGLKQLESPPDEKSRSNTVMDRMVLTRAGVNTKSIAVLPFEYTGNQDDDFGFLGDSISDEILNTLSLIKGIKVAPWASVSQFKKKPVNLSLVLEKLGTGSVIEGKIDVVKSGIKVSVTLKNTETGATLWSNQYDRPLQELKRITTEIAGEIISKLKISVRDEERKFVENASTKNHEAYLQFLRGRYYWRQQGDSLMKSLVCFRKSIELDSQFAAAFAGVANAYVLLGFYNLVPFEEAMQKSKQAAIDAINIDSSMVEAFNALAFVCMCYEWNWAEAEKIFSTVFSINPVQSNASARYRECFDQIVSHLNEAEMEPLITIPYFLKAFDLIHRGKFEQALQASQKAIDIEPNSFMAHRATGLSFIGLERFNDAIAPLEKAASLSNRHSLILFELMGAYMLSGKMDDARAIMDETLAMSNVVPSKIHNFFFPSV